MILSESFHCLLNNKIHVHFRLVQIEKNRSCSKKELMFECAGKTQTDLVTYYMGTERQKFRAEVLKSCQNLSPAHLNFVIKSKLLYLFGIL